MSTNENEVTSTTRLNFGEKVTPSFLPTDEQLAESEASIQVDQATDVEAAVEQPVEALVEAQALVPDETAEPTVDAAADPVDGSHADMVEEVKETISDNTSVDLVEELPEPEVNVVVEDDGETVETLRAQQDAINRRIEEKAVRERASVIAQIKNVVETYKIPVAELVAALGGLKQKRKGSPAKAKYRDGTNEWSGRGKAPLWIKDKTPAEREALLIK